MLQLKVHPGGPQRCRSVLYTPTRLQQEHSRALTRIFSTRNGSEASTTDSVDEDHVLATQTVEMYLNEEEPAASASNSRNGSEPAQTQQPRQLHRRRSMTVAPPRAKPVLQGTSQESALSPAWQQQQNAQMKKLRVELSMAQAELHTRGAETKKTQNKLRQQDRELARLRAALSERDERLRESKRETTSARAALQSKDTEMQQAYQRLTAACSERSAIRKQLINSQLTSVLILHKVSA
ncbi:hypothetical protein WJX73_004300 [Symbiochloris irregularis]|uniref:Uncharacterized protein n=1 Tax=Symbiochloris irregularis TaxID=706552 RepID=A0AAW1NQ09_9CHLO